MNFTEINFEIRRFKDICNNLERPKLLVTEKQQSLTQITEILKKVEIVNFINESSRCEDDESSDDAEPITWRTVYRAVHKVLSQELTKFRQSVESKSKRTSKLEAFDCFKLIVTLAFKVENSLNVDSVCKFLLENLNDDVICKTYFKDFSNLLANGILKHEEAVASMSEDLFKSFCSLYVDILLNNNDLSFDVTANTLAKLLNAGACQFDLDFRRLIKQFCYIFKRLSNKIHVTCLPTMVVCCNILMKLYGFEDRQVFCRLNESIPKNIILDFQLTDDAIVEFVLQQMIMHHPRGATKESNGAIINDNWKDIVNALYLRLYEIFDKDSSNLCTRHISEQQQHQRKQNGRFSAIIDLMARVVVQVYEWGDNVSCSGTTQLNSTFLKSNRRRISDNKSTATQSKRICIEVGWSAFVQNIDERLSSLTAVNWLLVLKSIIVNNFDCVEIEVLKLLTSSLLKWFSICKKSEILKTCCCVAKHLIVKLNDKSQSEFKDLLLKFYDVFVRLAFVKTLQDEIFDVLSSLVSCRVVNSKRIQTDLCRLLSSAINLPSKTSCQYVFEVFHRCEFLERLCDKSIFVDAFNLNEKFEFRLFVIDWLTGRQNNFEENALCALFASVPPEILAGNLHQICSKRPCQFSQVRSNYSKNETNVSELERYASDVFSVVVPNADLIPSSGRCSDENPVFLALAKRVLSRTNSVFADILKDANLVDAKIINSIWSFGYYVFIWMKSIDMADDDIKNLDERLDSLFSIIVERSAMFPIDKIDFIEKFLAVIQLSEQNRLCLPVHYVLIDFLGQMASSLPSSFKSQYSDNEFEDVRVETKQDISVQDDLKCQSVRCLVQLSCYFVNCPLKIASEEKILDILQETFDDDIFELSKKFALSLMFSIFDVAMKSSSSSSRFANQLLSFVKKALDHCYKNFNFCNELLLSCSGLPEHQCFRDAEVQEKFLKILTGFKKLDGTMKYTWKLKSILIRLLISIEKSIPSSKILLSENNNEVFVPILTVITDFLSDGCVGFYEICTNIVTLVRIYSRSEVEIFIKLLYNNAIQGGISDTKMFCFIRGLISVIKSLPGCHCACIFALCQICSLSAEYDAVVNKALHSHFSSEELDDIFATNLPFVISKWKSFGDWKSFPFALLDLVRPDRSVVSALVVVCKLGDNDELKEIIESKTQRQFHILVKECWPRICVNVLLSGNNPSPVLMESFRKMANVDLKQFFSKTFLEILLLAMNRLRIDDNASTVGEINEKIWLSFIQEILKQMGFRNIADCFSNILDITMVKFFQEIRLSIVGSKFYSEIRFARCFSIFSCMNFSTFGIFSTLIVREIVLTMAHLLQTACVNDKTLKFISLLCRKFYKETPNVFTNIAHKVLPHAVQLSEVFNRFEATELTKFLFSIWSQSNVRKFSNVSLLPPVDWFAECRNLQLKLRRETVSVTQDMERILSLRPRFITREDLEHLHTELKSEFSLVLSDIFKVAQLMNKCRLLCQERNSYASVVAKIVDFCYRRSFTLAVLPIIHCSNNNSVFKNIVKALDDHSQSENCEISSTAWKCLRHFLSNGNTKYQFEDPDYENNYLAPICGLEKAEKSYHAGSAEHSKIGDKMYFDFISHDIASDFIYDSWITKVLSNFVSQLSFPEMNFASLKELCGKSVSFCESLLPCVFEYILTKSTLQNRERFVEEINKLFGFLLQYSSCGNKIELRKCVSLFLSVLRRLQISSGSGCSLDKYKSLPIDYCLLAEICLVCGFYHESILFVEIGAESFRLDALYKDVYLDKSKKNILAGLSERFSKILQESFIRLANTDAVYGLDESALSNPSARCYLWLANHDWNKAISFYSSLNNVDINLFKQAVFALGINDECLMNYEKNEEALHAHRCQCAWRLGEWDLIEVSKTISGSFNQFIYDTISTEITDLKHVDIRHASRLINNQISHESWNDVQDFVEKMCLLNETENYINNILSLPPVLLQKWNSEASSLSHTNSDETSGRFCETYQSFRWAALHKHLHIFMDKGADVFDEAVACFVNITKARVNWCMSQNMPSVALKLANQCKTRVSTFESIIPIALSFAPDFCEIETLWKSGEQFLAISKLKFLQETLQMRNRNSTDASLLLAKCLMLLGEYQTKLNSPELAENCFTEAIQMLKAFSSNMDVAHTLCSAYASLARYTDEHYQSLTDYIKSSNFVSKKNLLDQFKQQCVSTAVKQSKMYLTITDKKSSVDQQEVDDILKTHENLMQMALSYYLNCLALSNEYDLKIFRVISLWFDNLHSIQLANSFVELAQNVPSHKWLFVWTQLTSHLSLVENNSDPFVRTLYEIIRKTALNHPYHAFYALYSLSNSSPNNDLEDKAKKSRMVAANKLIKELKQSAKGSIFKDLDDLANCYVEVGKIDSMCLDKRAKHPLPACIVNYVRNVPVITKHLPVQPSGSYKNFISVQKFENAFTVASGKSAPIILHCRYSDGTAKRQLVKGHDDTRQDAIMEQVFFMVNLLLQRDKPDACCSTSGMRTYNVVPLSPSCGIIEWCHGAISFGDYLVGADYRSGAHKRLRPDDWTGTECRSAIQTVAAVKLEKKIKTFTDVCSKLQPVFRHFFLEKFLEPLVWYEAVMNYTRSAAISSMVGHVLGLSDRHTQNILIDETTAEIIQIDLGMAFEQGRILPTPEKVPFRLTRDIVDGMGVCGVEGVFRRNCERIMRLLRDSADVLLPIVSVLLHDPVSEWTLTDSKVKKVQPSRSEQKLLSQSKNEHAERAILKVVEKLKGIEGTSILTVEGQVAYLINEARNPANLAQMYCGWQAYL